MRFSGISLDAHKFGIFDSALELRQQGIVGFDLSAAVLGVGEIRGELVHSVRRAGQNCLECRLSAPWKNAVVDGLCGARIYDSEKPTHAAKPAKLFWEGCRLQEFIHVFFGNYILDSLAFPGYILARN